VFDIINWKFMLSVAANSEGNGYAMSKWCRKKEIIKSGGTFSTEERELGFGGEIWV
jgi:hypothetical protein